MSKTRISYSSVNTFKECPTKYYNGKKFKMKLQASAFAFGAAVEDGVNALLEGKPLEVALSTFEANWRLRPENRFEKATKIFDSADVFYYKSDYEPRLLTKEDRILVDKWYEELFDDEFKGPQIGYSDVIFDMIKKGENPTETQRQFYQRVTWQCCLRRGLMMVKEFHDGILPDVEEVIAIQKEIKIENVDGDQALGFLDCILKLKGIEKPVLCDIKTAGRPYESHALDTSDQLRIYAAAENLDTIGYLILLKSIKFNKSCDKCGNQRVNYRKTKCEECEVGRYTVETPEASHQILTRKVEQRELDDILHDFSDVLAAIKNEIRWKNPNSCMNYGTKCEFYDSCWSGKKLEDMDHLKKRGK